MGCDIHLYVEKKVEGEWKAQGEFSSEDGSLDQPYENRFYTQRNYDLFAILADVCNGRGFAGIKTGEGFTPIAEPRGLPDDASEEVAMTSGCWGSDGHSHSHFTLRELLDYDWTQETKKQGWVSMEEWENWTRFERERGNGPDSYCGEVSGKDVKHITAAEADALFEGFNWEVRAKNAKDNANCYALAEWGTPHYRAAHYFISELIPKLLAIAGGVSGADDVRIVFFFDN